MTSETDAEFLDSMEQWVIGSLVFKREHRERLFTLARRGAHLCGIARSLGWPDDGGEGAFEFVVRLTREVALEDARRGAAVQWRPIEEAPKDELILVGPTKRMGTCAAMNHSRDGWVTETCADWVPIYTPTHWMPLPPPPAGETNE